MSTMAALQVSENWNDDNDFQAEKSKMSSNSNTDRSEATENWDYDFEDSRQSPKRIIQRHREGSWDDNDDDEENSEFGLFAEGDRTVTVKSRRAALDRLSAPSHLPHSPTSSVFSVPTTIHTYSSTALLRPPSAFALIPSPPIHKERERRRLRKKSRPNPQAVIELVEIPLQERASSDANLPRPASELDSRRTSRSDPSIHERPPLVASAVAETLIGPSNGLVSIPHTPTKGAALLSRIGSVKKWGVRRRGDSTTPTNASESFIEHDPIPNDSTWDRRRRKRGDSTIPADIPTGSRTRTGQSRSRGADEEDGEQKRNVIESIEDQADRMKYAGLGLGRVGVRGSGGEVNGDEGCETSGSPPKMEKRDRQPLSRLLTDRDRENKGKDVDVVLEKEKERHEKEKGKEDTLSFMGSVRRISFIFVGVVGRHKTKSSGGGFLGVGGGSSSPACIPPVPTLLPSALSCASQVSLKIPSSSNTASGQRSTSSHTSIADLRRVASLSSPNDGGDASSGPTATFAPAAPVRSNSSSHHSHPLSILSTKRHPRKLSKSKSKPGKSEESPQDGGLKADLDFQQEQAPFF